VGIDEVGEFLRAFHFNVLDLPSAFDALVTLAPSDAEAILRYNPQARVFVNEASADVYEPPVADVDEERPDEARPLDEPTFLFVANYRHPPNTRAALFLANEIMPLVRRRFPKARLQLVGPHPPGEIKALASEHVEVRGFVDDLSDVYLEATAALAPITMGTGMRIKAVEALSYGCPFIGTELALRGLEAAVGQAALRAEGPEEFANAAIQIASDLDFASRLGEAGRRYVEENLGLERLADSRDAVWAAVLESSDASSTSGRRGAATSED
jgi:glycosyltransferase involved in cell wall biosynthesis